MLAELPFHQHAQGRSVPIIGDEKIVGGAHRHEPGTEAVEEVINGARARGRLPRDGVGHGEQILAAMRELAQQETELVFVGLALADIDRDRCGPDNTFVLVPQCLDHEVERALPPKQLETGFKLLRGAGRHRLALRSHNGLRLAAGEDLGVGLADQLFGREAGRRVMHPGKAHILVLAEHGDGRAAERDLDAPFRLRQLLGARLDALLQSMPRFFQLVGGTQMSGDLGLETVARGKPQPARCEPPEDGSGGGRERGTDRGQDAFRFGADVPRPPNLQHPGKMSEANRGHEECGQRQERGYTGTVPASVSIDQDQSGGDGEEGQRDEGVRQEIEPFEPSRPVSAK